MPLPAGTRLGPYEVLSPLGAGGMGEVYRARDTRLERDVAIKVLPADRAADPDRLRRFELEARAAGRLNHPNILAIHDVGRVPDGAPSAGAPFLVMELLDGRTLREELTDHALSVRTALAYARDIADGLAAAHDKAIVHRDLKPDNLFITHDGRVKILDFGLAKLRAGSDSTKTATAAIGTDAGVVLGTTSYMSPEQVRAQNVDHRADVFAFGSVLYEMLTGRRAFHGETSADTMSAILHADPPPMRADSGQVIPAAIERVVRRCLEKAPERRFQSARDLAFSFETLSDASGAASAATPVEKRGGFGRGPVAIVGVALIGLAGWAIWSNLKNPSPSTAPASAEPPTLTPFLVSEAVEALPSWSPTGNLVAYMSDAAGNDDVWMSDLSGANPINLTKSHEGLDSFPVWSPDGQRIAFYSERDGGGVFTMATFGSDVRKIVAVRPSVVYTFSLQWAANGSIVYTNFDEDGAKQIYQVSSTDPRPACLTCDKTTVIGARAGALSPSGTRLAYVGGLTGPRAPVYVMDRRSGHVTVVAEQGDQPHWRNDDQLLFLSARYEVSEVAVDSRTGAKVAEPRAITAGLDASEFAVSADGRRVLAVKQKRTSTLWTLPTRPDRIENLSAGVPLTTGLFRDARPRWSADGREVFFESNRRGAVQLWKVPSAGGTPTRLTAGTRTEIRPRPSPDGRWVTFDVDGIWLWLMRPDGSGSHPGAEWQKQFSAAGDAAWSPDASKVALELQLFDGSSRLGIADVDSTSGSVGQIRVRDVPGGLEEYPRWSPDGRTIAYESFSDGSWNLWTVDADGQSPRRLTTLPGNERQAAWQATPLFVYFLNNRALWRMAMANPSTPSGPPVPWLVIPRLQVAADSVDISRDGTRLVVALIKPESDIWLVERK